MVEKTESSEEQVSKEETASTETETETEEKSQAQPFTPEQEARIQQLTAEAKEMGKREMQGIKDREVAEAQRRARLAEGDSQAYKSSFSDLDDETRDKAELARLRGREQQQSQQGQWDDFRSNLIQSLQDEASALGIDPNDERIDYAPNEADYFAGRKRFTASISKITKENQKMAEDKQSQTFKDMEAKMRKELGLDSVVTDTSAGVSKGIPTDMTKFREWVADLPDKEYQEKKADIDEMLAKGLIK